MAERNSPVNYFLGTSALYPAIGKPFITVLAAVLVLWALSGFRWKQPGK